MGELICVCGKEKNAAPFYVKAWRGITYHKDSTPHTDACTAKKCEKCGGTGKFVEQQSDLLMREFPCPNGCKVPMQVFQNDNVSFENVEAKCPVHGERVCGCYDHRHSSGIGMVSPGPDGAGKPHFRCGCPQEQGLEDCPECEEGGQENCRQQHQRKISNPSPSPLAMEAAREIVSLNGIYNLLTRGDTEGAEVDIAPIIQAAIDEATGELRIENICDACVGTGKPISGLDCMCRGTGRMSEAARFLRERVVALEAAIETVQCACSIQERLSGHLVDCWMPDFIEALNRSAKP